MAEEPKNQSDAFTHSVYLKFLKETNDKHKPLRIAFLEQHANKDELTAVLTKLHDFGYCVFLINNEETQLLHTVEGNLETTLLRAVLRQINGEYQSIAEYSEFMKQKSTKWRAVMMQMFARLKKESYLYGLGDIEEDDDGKNKVSLPDFRFVLNFNKSTMGDDENYAKAQRECIEQIKEFQNECAEKFNNLNGQKESEEFLRTIIDLRVSNESNPEKNELKVYITPNHMIKNFFAYFIIEETCKRMGIKRNDLDHVLICAESYTDLHNGSESIMALANPDDPAQLIPQTTYFIPLTTSFTHVMRKLQNAVEGVREDDNIIIKSDALPIIPSKDSGHYIYKPARNNPDLEKLKRKVAEEKQSSDSRAMQHHIPTAEIIVADEAFSKAQAPVESVLMYLKQKYPSN